MMRICESSSVLSLIVMFMSYFKWVANRIPLPLVFFPMRNASFASLLFCLLHVFFWWCFFFFWDRGRLRGRLADLQVKPTNVSLFCCLLVPIELFSLFHRNVTFLLYLQWLSLHYEWETIPACVTQWIRHALENLFAYMKYFKLFLFSWLMNL